MVNEGLKLYANPSERVYIIVNDEYAGQRLLLENFMNYWAQNKVKKKDNCTAADAICLITNMLYQEHCVALTQFLSKKRTRETMDQAFDPDISLFDMFLVLFN